MATLSINDVITVTLLSALKGLADLNTSILAIFTAEEPVSSSYGDYGIYKSPQGVATDFGSSSTTYALAVDVFSQNPNILSGGGYLVVIPLDQSAAASVATILGTAPVDFTDLTATDYYINAAIDGAAAADIAIGELDTTSLATLTTSLNPTALTTAGLAFVVSGDVSNATVKLVTIATGTTASIVTGTATTGTDLLSLVNIAGTAYGADAGVEKVKDAVLRTAGSIPYFGIILTEKPSTDALILELAATVQTYDKLLFLASSTYSDIAGIFTTLMNDSYTHTRCLYYSVSEATALDFAACYAGRGLCIDFDGSNTAHTMHLKDLTGLDADTGMTETILTACGNAGVDTYVDFGVAKVFTSGSNLFFDQIYTRLAFKSRLQIAGFNYLAETSTKIPQTEQGMSGLKSALRKICAAFVTNGTFAPGTWNSSTTFGDPDTHVKNIAAVGYYIYSDSISAQSQTKREARIAPKIYIAAKDAGAIHSADLVAYIEA